MLYEHVSSWGKPSGKSMEYVSTWGQQSGVRRGVSGGGKW